MSEITIDQSSPLIPSIPPQRRHRDGRSNNQKILTRTTIILSAGLERLAFYSLAGNLTFFLGSKTLAWQFPTTIIAALIFLGASNISALFFSWVSDGKLGRPRTILIGYLIYIIGYVLFSLISYDSVSQAVCTGSHKQTTLFYEQFCVSYIAPVLIFTAIGVGAVQANTAVLGAEQAPKTKENRFFDYYYAAINVGALVAYGAIAYVQLDDRSTGYMISTGFLVLAFICYLIGFKFYYEVPPYDSVVSILPQVVFNAIATWYKTRRDQRRINDFNQSNDTLARTSQSDDEAPLVYSVRNKSWSFLDYAKAENEGSFTERQVNDIKGLRRVVVVFALLITYWLLYFQVETTFIVQGAHMALPKSKNFNMPVVWLSLGNQIVIIVLIFILNTFVYKHLKKSDRSLSLKTRIIIGLTAAVLAMLWAGSIEKIRLDIASDKEYTFNQTIGDSNYTATNMSIFYQFPQYVGIGISEVFASVASLEFAYQIAPQSAQSLIMSLRFFMSGIASFIGSVIIVLFNIGNTEKDIYHNDDIYYIYFFSLAILQTIFIGIFLLCDHKYKILRLPPNRYRSFLSGSSSTSSK